MKSKGDYIHHITRKIKISLTDEIEKVPKEFRDIGLMLNILVSICGSMVAEVAVMNEDDLDIKDALIHPGSQELLKALAIQLLSIDIDSAHKLTVEEI